MIIYELLENSFLHAFESGSLANYVHITLLSRTDYEPVAHFLDLTVQDSGIGIANFDGDFENAGAGLAIVRSIVKQLNGTLEATFENGAVIKIIIPNAF
jgi:two-component sensor histidine kinase